METVNIKIKNVVRFKRDLSKVINKDDIEAFKEWNEPVEKLNKLLNNIEEEIKYQRSEVLRLKRKGSIFGAYVHASIAEALQNILQRD